MVERRGSELTQQDIEKLLERDYFMSAQDAVKLGVVDEILQSRKKPQEEEENVKR